MCRWLLLLTLCSRFAPGAATEPPGIAVPRAVGVAPLGEDAVAARARALLDAQRNAIEAALGVMVKSDTAVDKYALVKDTVTTDTVAGYVYGVEVVQEEADRAAGLYKLAIACRVGSEPLVSYLGGNFPQVYEELERPRLLILAAEKQADGQPTTVFSTQLGAALAKRGLDVVDAAQVAALTDRDKVQQALQGNPEAVSWMAAELNAELVIRGEATVGPAACQAAVNVVDASDARILAGAQAAGATVAEVVGRLLPGGQEPEDLVNQLLGRWLAQPTVFTVIMARATLAEVRQVLAALEPATRPREIDFLKPLESSRPPALGQATRRSFNPTRTVLEIRSPLRREAALALLEPLFKQVGYELSGLTGTRFDLVPTAK